MLVKMRLFTEQRSRMATPPGTAMATFKSTVVDPLVTPWFPEGCAIAVSEDASSSYTLCGFCSPRGCTCAGRGIGRGGTQGSPNLAAESGLASECEKQGGGVLVPPSASCTDHAAMIAYAGAQRLLSGERDCRDNGVFFTSPVLRA